MMKIGNLSLVTDNPASFPVAVQAKRFEELAEEAFALLDPQTTPDAEFRVEAVQMIYRLAAELKEAAQICRRLDRWEG